MPAPPGGYQQGLKLGRVPPLRLRQTRNVLHGFAGGLKTLAHLSQSGQGPPLLFKLQAPAV